jgi:hypothetical protein
MRWLGAFVMFLGIVTSRLLLVSTTNKSSEGIMILDRRVHWQRHYKAVSSNAFKIFTKVDKGVSLPKRII